jgi:hypothetical protein
MALAQGVKKEVRVKKEVTFGVAPGTGSAVLMRRVESSFDVVKDTYESAEIVTHQQVADFRHGARRVEGNLNGELSPTSYQIFMEAMLRKAFAAGGTTGAQTNITAAAGPPGTFTRAAGSYLTDGFKVGDVVRWTGWTTGGVANNARNYRITALSATVMTTSGLNDEVVAAKASGDSVTCTVQGKKCFTPDTGQTNDSLSIEQWFPDITQSELYRGIRLRSMAVSLPATGLATISFGFLGQDITRATSQYYISPTAAATTGILAAVSGSLRIGGVDYATVTGLEFTVDTEASGLQVVGANITPDVFVGRLKARGQMTVAFENAVLRDMFIDETEADIQAYFRLSSAVNSDFLSFYLPRVKAGGAQKSDGEQSLIQTIPFVGLYQGAGGTGTTSDKTTFTIQDSLL